MILLLGRLEVLDAGDEGLSSPSPPFFWEGGIREGRLQLQILILFFFLIRGRGDAFIYDVF